MLSDTQYEAIWLHIDITVSPYKNCAELKVMTAREWDTLNMIQKNWLENDTYKNNCGEMEQVWLYINNCLLLDDADDVYIFNQKTNNRYSNIRYSNPLHADDTMVIYSLRSTSM